MEKEFSLEAILTSITGITCVKDFDEFFQLVWFVFNDDGINTTGLMFLANKLKEHLLELYPQLAEVQYNPSLEESLDSWLSEQKKVFGKKLKVSQIAQSMSPKKRHK